MIKPINKDQLFLAQPSEPADPKNPADRAVAQDLLDTLKAHSEACIGLAANMIGVRKRIIVFNLGLLDMVMYNPVITAKEEPYEDFEECLSIPGSRRVTRYNVIEVEFTDPSGMRRHQRFRELPAQIIQHECDHLEGILV